MTGADPRLWVSQGVCQGADPWVWLSQGVCRGGGLIPALGDANTERQLWEEGRAGVGQAGKMPPQGFGMAPVQPELLVQFPLNSRMVQVGRNHTRSSCPASLLEQGYEKGEEKELAESL